MSERPTAEKDARCVCRNNPTIDGYRLRSADCTAHPPIPTPEPEGKDLTEDQVELACAWSDYRSAYGAEPCDHKAFKAGWEAARGAMHNGALR